MRVNPKSFRPKKKVIGSLDVLLDEDAKKEKWYCLDLTRDTAVALLDNDNTCNLGDGAFVVMTSALDFANLCMLYQGNMMNIPIKNDEDGLFITIVDYESATMNQCPAFPTLSKLIRYLSSEKGKQSTDGRPLLPCVLNPVAVEASQYAEAVAQAKNDPVYEIPDSLLKSRKASKITRVPKDSVDYDLGMNNSVDYALGEGSNQSTTYDIGDGNKGVDYDIAQPLDDTVVYDVGQTPATEASIRYDNMDGEQMLPGENYEVLQRKKTIIQHVEGYVDTPNTEDSQIVPEGADGYIRISNQSFDKHDNACGISFQPCKTNQWFFVGLSNIKTNYHGHKDIHYDDIDYSIFCMGSGKATAREFEDEVGPYVVYEPGDTFEIRVVLKGYTNYDENKQRKGGNKKVNKKKPLNKKKLDKIERHVHYLLNGRVFYISTRVPIFPLWIDQAFHPESLNTDVIKNPKWLSD
eukprot:m.32477 g.32477  ORF g.32477 m.32477 type:complete len:464 (-) comp9784_c0_seq1:131-1522(-)